MKLLPLLLLLLLPTVVQAQFTCTTNNGALVITAYTGSGGDVTVPGTSNGLPVIIGDAAFINNNTLTSLTLLNGVKNIGVSICYNCPNLASVTIPGSVTNIGNNAFYFCPSLTNASIGNGVANIGAGAFTFAPLFSLTLPGSVTNIGPGAFDSCYPLTSLTIPASVKNIGSNAFYNCYRIPGVVIPASVASIGVGAFELCDAMTNITVDAANPNYASVAGVLFNKNLTVLLEYPGGGNGSSNYVIPGSVKSIGVSAFNGCTALLNLTIPGSVTNIGNAALRYCFGMTSITVDATNPKFASADGAFYDKAITRVLQYPAGRSGTFVIPGTVKTIAAYSCEECAMNHVLIPSSVTNIEGWAFAYNWSLADVTIPGSVRNIRSEAFWNCNGLTNVTILDGVTNIESSAFDSCSGLTSVTLPASLQTIGVQAFGNCSSLTNVYCLGNAPTAVTDIFSGNNSAFTGDPGTVYYLPGTTGWTNTFGGLPTALWYLPNPLILNNGSGIGVRTNRFGFTISWATNVPVVVEACTNLSNPAWQPVKTNTLSGGTAYFSDPQWTNFPGRFYRLRSP